ncbi:unnamed protein product, partial [Mesorhabditis spiculigera]
MTSVPPMDNPSPALKASPSVSGFAGGVPVMTIPVSPGNFAINFESDVSAERPADDNGSFDAEFGQNIDDGVGVTVLRVCGFGDRSRPRSRRGRAAGVDLMTEDGAAGRVPWMKTTGKPSVALSSTAMTPCRVSILVVVIGILIVRSARSAGIHATGHMRHKVHSWTSHCARAVGTVTRPTLRTNLSCGIDFMWRQR